MRFCLNTLSVGYTGHTADILPKYRIIDGGCEPEHFAASGKQGHFCLCLGRYTVKAACPNLVESTFAKRPTASPCLVSVQLNIA
jgi:hypothetical protein